MYTYIFVEWCNFRVGYVNTQRPLKLKHESNIVTELEGWKIKCKYNNSLRNTFRTNINVFIYP